jgi:hypothetical protein
MTERPILFNDEMVRAILEKSKTQTRRPVKSQPPSDYDFAEYVRYGGSVAARFENHPDPAYSPGMWTTRCPYGQPGDRLWVRETWQESPFMDTKGEILYQASWNTSRIHPTSWRNRRHMPQDKSRITLEVTEVRVERLRRITLSDICAEGTPAITDSPIVDFGKRWDAIYDKKGLCWEANPWVWVVSFLTEPNQDEAGEPGHE